MIMADMVVLQKSTSCSREDKSKWKLGDDLRRLPGTWDIVPSSSKSAVLDGLRRDVGIDAGSCGRCGRQVET